MKDCIYILIFLIIGIIDSRYQAPTRPNVCPDPEHRAIAWNTGKTCEDMRRTCCFDEVVDSGGKLTNISCCYTGGNIDPIKCCGYNHFPLWLLGIIIPITVWIIIVVSLLVCTRCLNNKHKQNTNNSESDL